MQDNILYFSKGLDNNQFGNWKQIARVKEAVTAYSIQIFPKYNNRPSLLYFDSNGDGRFQINSGNDGYGNPILIDPETSGSTTIFNY